MRYKILCIVILLNISSYCVAQKTKVGNWFIYLASQRINKKWNWHNEIQYRNYNFAGDLQQLLLRTGIGYNLSENNNNILLGYGFIRSENYVPNTTSKAANNEHRVYQQFITKQSFNGITLQHRYRVEERFLTNNFKMRFRYFLSVNIPVTNKTMVKNTLYLSSYDEIFISGESPLFDRNRLYGGLGYVLSKDIKVELGFMAQTLENTNRNQFQVIIFNNLPFSKEL